MQVIDVYGGEFNSKNNGKKIVFVGRKFLGIVLEAEIYLANWRRKIVKII